MSSDHQPTQEPSDRENEFSFKAPGGISVQTDRTLLRANGQSERFLLVEVTAPTVAPDPSRARPPVNLAFVLDRSGSMSAAGKLDLAKVAVESALARLQTEDRFAVVVYDDRVDVVLEGSPASAEARRLAGERLARIDARGSTDLGTGWLTGCEQVAVGQSPDGVNRALLLTDGLANVGITDHDELVRHAAELRERGISTTTFGVGTDFDESLLQAMADAGGGHFTFIGSAVQIRDAIASEVGETLDVVARDVVVDITMPEAVRVEALTPFPTEQRGSRTAIRLGDLVSGQTIRIVLRLRFPLGGIGRDIGALVNVGDRDEVFRRSAPALAPVALVWQFDTSQANDTQRRDRHVDRAVAAIFAARAQQQAVALNRQGRFGEAAHAIDGVRRRIEGYAGSDAELQRLVAMLGTEAPSYAAAMPEMQRKQRHFMASAQARSRPQS
ncbi:MAG: vWA domain-containing protein [Chloroflexota bacterium]